MAFRCNLAAAAMAATLIPCGLLAQDIKLPPQMSWTAYDTGSSGFNIAVAVGQVMKNKFGSDVRVLPAGNDVARLAPLRQNRAALAAMGIGIYFAQEGVFEFGVKEIKDLKGKRIAIVVGSPALNQGAYGILAFGGLTKNDVKLVEFSSNNAMWKGVVNNEADAAFTSTISGQSKELEASPRGIVFPPTPHNDKAGWERLQKLTPYFYPHIATCGSGGITKDNTIPLPAYPYPIMMVYANQTDEVAYALTKAMIVGYDDYKDGAPGADGLEVKRQNLQWVIPYHAGAVKALKEAGVWTDAAQKHNDMLLKRQEVLATAWKDYAATNPADDKHAEGWVKARAAALTKAGMDPVFD